MLAICQVSLGQLVQAVIIMHTPKKKDQRADQVQLWFKRKQSRLQVKEEMCTAKPFSHSPGLGFCGFFDAVCLRNVNAVAVHHFPLGQVGCFVFNWNLCSSFPSRGFVPSPHTAAPHSSLKLQESAGTQTSLSVALATSSCFPPSSNIAALSWPHSANQKPKASAHESLCWYKQTLRTWDVCASFVRRNWRALSSYRINPIHKSRGRDVNQFSFPSVDPKAFEMSEGAGFISILQKGKLRPRVRHIAQLAVGVDLGTAPSSYRNTKTPSSPTALTLSGLLTLQTISQEGREQPVLSPGPELSVNHQAQGNTECACSPWWASCHGDPLAMRHRYRGAVKMTVINLRH